MKIGLKLYSTDTVLIPEAEVLNREGYFDYIELYTIPGSYEETINKWKELNCPFIIHAPHSFHGINFAQAEKWQTNHLNFGEAQKFANIMHSDTIIVHGGNNGSFDETVNQLAMLNDHRIALENKPKVGVNGEACAGWSPDEFKKADDAGILYGTVLDFGHAIYAANSSDLKAMDMIGDLMIFEPRLFHLSDGDSSSEKDVHYNLGEGNFDLAEIASLIPESGLLTIETPRKPSDNLQSFVKDVQYLQKLLTNKT